MSGYIFLCSNETEKECLTRHLFGTSDYNTYEKAFSKIEIGDYIFLYNYSEHYLKGPFKAISRCSPNIEKAAWKDAAGRGFPYQIRVSLDEQFCCSIPGNEVYQIVRHSDPRIKKYPVPIITSAQTDSLISKLRQKSSSMPENKTEIKDEELASYYIFKCDRTTGGRVFHENIMGAPIEAFNSIISKIQYGDKILLWVIEERKLYGIWMAKSRGQYNPSAFPEAALRNIKAVVYCNRILNFEKGIDENILRRIIAYDGTIPPYRISYESGKKIEELLIQANNVQMTIKSDFSAEKGIYLTDDGHWVKSHAEIIIDNWLFYHNIIHGYEHRLQAGKQFLKCDFYLPQGKIFIEYWGMAGKPEYDRRRLEKLQLYKQLNIAPLELFPADMSVLPEILQAKLNNMGMSIN